VPQSWRGWLLALTVPAYLAAILSGFVVAGDAGATVSAALILAVTAACLALDARGFVTLGGRFTWQRMTFWRRLLALFVFWLFFVAPALVLWQHLRAANQARRAALLARPGQIARLERELGMGEPPHV
jgi:hypothetical protein